MVGWVEEGTESIRVLFGVFLYRVEKFRFLGVFRDVF